MSELAAGMVVAERYRLERIVGRGGMGAVWAARHVQLNTPLALKFLEPLADTSEGRARFEREARTAAQIRSPYVVQVFDHGVDHDRPYIAMELLEGEDLGQRLTRERRISLPSAARIVVQASKALRRAHDGGVIHRDLKPSNVFLALVDEEEEVVKLLDFGVAKLRWNDLDPNANATQTGMVFGSPSYMSPEQARGLRSIDHRSDLWSLAVILFRAITGQKPFNAPSMGDLVIKLCIDALPRPSAMAPHLPPEIDRFFERAFARDPDERFQSATELGTEFDAVVAKLPLSALGPPPPMDDDAVSSIGSRHSPSFSEAPPAQAAVSIPQAKAVSASIALPRAPPLRSGPASGRPASIPVGSAPRPAAPRPASPPSGPSRPLVIKADAAHEGPTEVMERATPERQTPGAVAERAHDSAPPPSGRLGALHTLPLVPERVSAEPSPPSSSNPHAAAAPLPAVFFGAAPIAPAAPLRPIVALDTRPLVSNTPSTPSSAAMIVPPLPPPAKLAWQPAPMLEATPAPELPEPDEQAQAPLRRRRIVAGMFAVGSVIALVLILATIHAPEVHDAGGVASETKPALSALAAPVPSAAPDIDSGAGRDASAAATVETAPAPPASSSASAAPPKLRPALPPKPAHPRSRPFD